MTIERLIRPFFFITFSSMGLFSINSIAGSARDYLNAPIDSWLGFYNVGYSSSVTPEDGIDITSDIRANVLSQSFMLTRTMDYWGRTGGLSLVLPYRYVETNSDNFRSSTRGISDIGMLWQINLFGGPALSREKFRYFIPETFSSFHFYLGTPLGKYDAYSALNPSSNRWVFSPTINYSYTPDQGWTWIETYITTTVFTTNDNYRVAGATKLGQDPLIVIEGHVSRNMTPEVWVSIDSYYNVGGETRIDDIAQDNAANTLRLGTGIGIRAWDGGDIIVNYERVVAKPSQQPESQTIRMTLRQFW
ncbi:transporter [Yersinia frederiksenii]|uniref:transporter n=1 Tax=Yersinia frederiksenii TaxID=29484 RepID=UPI0005E3AE71|nr:transporter [Yersinia frederiksenii]CQJ05426.1 Protein involved in meta-pathway of phenol degradation [Yersinia frederiksenii]